MLADGRDQVVASLDQRAQEPAGLLNDFGLPVAFVQVAGLLQQRSTDDARRPAADGIGELPLERPLDQQIVAELLVVGHLFEQFVGSANFFAVV